MATPLGLDGIGMSEIVSQSLRSLRMAAGWSLGRLAREAGVDKSTLSRWESGDRTPCIPELTAVLDALHCAPEQRAAAVAGLCTSRAQRHLTKIAPAVGLPAPPRLGDLLRAIRLRSGLTQEQAAAAIGVGRTALTRWERGDRRPTVEERHALCFHLGARESEIVAVTTLARDEPIEDAPESWPERRADLMGRLALVNNGGMTGQEELHYLVLEDHAWRSALQHDDARPMLAMIYAHHGHYLRLEQRWKESAPLADQALAIASKPDGDITVFVRAALLKAAVLSRTSGRQGPAAALRMLRQVAARDGMPPEYAAWILADTAEYLLRAGYADDAVTVCEEACAAAEACSNPVEPYLRRCNLCERLVDAGRPMEALRRAPDPPANFAPVDKLPSLLLFARAHRAVGNINEARSFLQTALTLSEGPALRRWHTQAGALAARM